MLVCAVNKQTHGWEEFQSGESLDFELGDLVGGGVHLGDYDVIVVLESLGEFLPLGGELFAVAAPRSV